MKPTQGLHKFTEAEKKIQQLLQKKKITTADLDNLLSDAERDIWAKEMTEKLNSLKGIERDEFLEKVEGITTQGTKNQIWEFNHVTITRFISKHMQDYGMLPNKNQIAEGTGLSRTTIHKHLKEYDSHPLYAEEMKKFRFMADRVLAKMFQLAISDRGDVKAARLYFEVLGLAGNGASQRTTIMNQKNYIQINGRVVSQDAIKSLSDEQVQLIEKALSLALPSPDTI